MGAATAARARRTHIFAWMQRMPFQRKKYRRAGDDNKSRATEILGISRESLYRKMRQYEIPL